MPTTPERVAPPSPRRRRTSARQAEIMEALEWLAQGRGVEVGDYLALALDRSRVGGLSQARAALANMRWALNPNNKKSGRADSDKFGRLFAAAGRGGIRIEEQDGEILIFVPKSYAGVAKAPITAKESKEKKTLAKV